MKYLKIKEIIDLVVGEVPDAESKIQKMFEWYLEREKLIITWMLGAAASLFISVLIAFFKKEIELEWWQTSLIIIFSLGTAFYGVIRVYHIRSMNAQFVSALKLLSNFKKISQFLIRYRDEMRNF